LEKNSRPRLTHDSAVGTAAASFSGEGGGDGGDEEALERRTLRWRWERRWRRRGETRDRVRSVGLGIPPPPERKARWGRSAAAAIAVLKGG
jgi:hypothetical protein